MRWRLCKIRNSGRCKLNSTLLWILTWLRDLNFPIWKVGEILPSWSNECSVTVENLPWCSVPWHSILMLITVDNPFSVLTISVPFSCLRELAFCNLEIPDECSMIFRHLSPLNPRFLWLRLVAARWSSPLHPCAVPLAPKSTGMSSCQTLSVWSPSCLSRPTLGEFPCVVIYILLDKQNPRISRGTKPKLKWRREPLFLQFIHSFHTFLRNLTFCQALF